MLPSDSLESAEAMERELGGTHLWDDQYAAASAFATALGAEGKIAWDAYLYFPPGSTWSEPAPRPAEWAHQLGVGGWADPSRYATGDALSERLRSFAA